MFANDVADSLCPERVKAAQPDRKKVSNPPSMGKGSEQTFLQEGRHVARRPSPRCSTSSVTKETRVPATAGGETRVPATAGGHLTPLCRGNRETFGSVEGTLRHRRASPRLCIQPWASSFFPVHSKGGGLSVSDVSKYRSFSCALR